MFDSRTDLEIPRALWSGWIPRHGARAIVRRLTGAHVLVRRAEELRAALAPYARPADDDRVALALSDMFGGFRSMRESGADALGRLDSAMVLLREFPVWAIEQACHRIRLDGYAVADRDGGMRIERHWPPSDPEIVALVRAAVKPYRTAMANAELLLAAPVEPPASPQAAQHDWHVFDYRRHRALGDGRHAQRVLADLEARKAQREAQEEDYAA